MRTTPSSLPAGAGGAAAPQLNRARLLLLAIALALLVGGLFGMPRLYTLWCRYAGTQTNPNRPELLALPPSHSGRFITVLFEGVALDSLPVRIYPDQVSQQVELGQQTTNLYHITNVSGTRVHFRPVHTLSPLQATTRLALRQCFCFQNQELGPHESRDFPVVYIFQPGLDERITTVTMRYSLFSLEPAPAAPGAAGVAP
jgi:cytochrome c oxidase assembly protein subunit 11